MTDTTTASIGLDIESTIDTHLAGYCEPDAERRIELLRAAWSDEGRLIDPPFDGTGPDGIATMVDAVLGHYPDHTLPAHDRGRRAPRLRPVRVGAGRTGRHRLSRRDRRRHVRRRRAHRRDRRLLRRSRSGRLTAGTAAK